MATAVAINDRPSCFRFPRGNGLGVDLASYGVGTDLKGKPWELGKGVVRRQGKDVALVGYGTSVNDCLAAADMLAERGIQATVTDMRYAALVSLRPGHPHTPSATAPATICERHALQSAFDAHSIPRLSLAATQKQGPCQLEKHGLDIISENVKYLRNGKLAYCKDLATYIVLCMTFLACNAGFANHWTQPWSAGWLRSTAP